MSKPAGSPPPFGAAQRREWPLDPVVTYLNHGGYGVTPRRVLAEQATWRARIDANPMRFMQAELPALQRAAAVRLAAHLNGRGEDLVFVENATAGCNAVLRSLDLGPGDEILMTSLAYGAVAKAARHAARRSGAALVEVEIPLPLPDRETLLAAVAARLGPRTRLALFDHIASSSALLLPVADLVRLAHEAGALVLIDGAHAPGQVPLDLAAIAADWYVGNCHKWLLAPRACGFLWASPSVQALTHPLAISHGLDQGFLAEFDWTGTHDPSPALSVPAAIACHEEWGGSALMARNAQLAGAAADLLRHRWGTERIGPADMFAAMVTVRLPHRGPPTRERGLELQRWLSDAHRLEAAVMPQAGELWVRIAAQAYNELGDYEKLAALF